MSANVCVGSYISSMYDELRAFVVTVFNGYYDLNSMLILEKKD